MVPLFGKECELVPAPDSVPSLSQALLLALSAVLVFFASSYVALRTAKRVRIPFAEYGEALWATFFKNGSLAVAGPVLDGWMGLPPFLTIALVVAVLPIAIYRKVFASTLRQATIVWAVVLGAEAVVGVVLVVGSVGGGAWLDQQFGLPGLLSSNAGLAP